MNQLLQITLIASLLVILCLGQKSLVTFKEFEKAFTSTGYTKPTKEQYDAFVQGLPKGLITTKEEAAMALAHFLHESLGLSKKIEIQCKDTGCPGEYRVPGCDSPDKGYFGRGYIQLSWCYNYKDASHDLYGDDRLVNDPDMVAREESVAWDTAFWFWKSRVHSKPEVAQGAFGVTTRAINGGLECDNPGGHQLAKKRFEMYNKIRAAFGLKGAGKEQGCYN
ncbi:endochitinase At2g43610-like [Bradysia coprophila]|uniref:endochitinase At2g43610-like n=1 Tax=Bradysia coprophila TaxID=38358 RepID=UPI00187DD0B3|nr:endochitinase At2g43610-like [Bradysia coprophila]XP_037039893.1 endochitinase At2g43610-like [Bradysia coprophila]